MIGLGLTEHPETGHRTRDLSVARHNIELLKLLRSKTQGNLTADEQKLLESLLYDLKMSYVQQKES